MERITEFKKSLLFYQFLLSRGFSPQYNPRVLELGKYVSESISVHLKDHETQFLLSEKVREDELLYFEMNGATGYLEADCEFAVKNGMKLFTPTIDLFDTVICEGDASDKIHVGKRRINLFFGYCIDYYDQETIENKLLNLEVLKINFTHYQEDNGDIKK